MDGSNNTFQPLHIPRDSEGYVKSFTLSSYNCSEAVEARAFFEQYGFVVITNVFTPEQCATTISDIWNVIESFTGKSMRNDENQWISQNWYRTGLVQEGIIGNASLWTRQILLNRQISALHVAFAAILETENLLVNHDRYGMFRPAKEHPKRVTMTNLHLDMNPWNYIDDKDNTHQLEALSELQYKSDDDWIDENNEPGCAAVGELNVQGLVNLADNLEEDGGFWLVPGFHKYMAQWAIEHEPLCKKFGRHYQFLLFDKDDIPDMYAAACHISTRAGSAILWDQRTMHGSRANASLRPRFAQFFKMFPTQHPAMTLERAEYRRQAILAKLQEANIDPNTDLTPLVRFHDTLVQIQTIVFNGIECLCLEDVQHRFPSITVLCIDNIQLAFLRDNNGTQLTPLRIEACPDKIIEAIEPIGKSNDVIHTFINHIDIKMQEMNKKTDLILANTQETLHRIKHLMTLMYELHEYTTPHYFIILPVNDHSWTSINGIQNLFLLQYKLYFLCECSDEPDKLHIAPHDGYTIKQPKEFIAHYGSYLRTTLQIARGLLSIGGFIIPQSENISTVVANTLPRFIKEPTNYDDVNNKLDVVEKVLDQTNTEVTHIDSSMIQKAILPETPLQGAQLRELEVFLDRVDDKHSLGNLYRTITDNGHVRWVCLEHYNTIGFNNKMLEYIRQFESIGGKFNMQRKEAILTGNLTAKHVNLFCDALKNGFTMLTLILQNCSIDIKDLDKLFDTIINRSSIHQLVIFTIEVRKWKGISKFICDHIEIYFKNQSLKVHFSTNNQNESIKLFIQILKQNKICRTLNIFGYDLLINDQNFLKDNQQLTTLSISHFMNNEFLNKILTSNFLLRRLKLSFWLNSSSTLYTLCQAIQQNNTLVELDIMDHTCVDDKTGTIELLKILRKHKSIKHLRLHVYHIELSNENETYLIDSLLHDTFITHLRISQSIISHELITAIIHACQEIHSLIHLEFYNSQLNEDDISKLQLLHTNGNLTYLSISEQDYWSIVATEFHNEYPQYQNIKLEQKLEQYYNHTSICLDEMELIDEDMNILVKQVIINKQCQLLSLQSNKITSIGISILANALNDNHTLETLKLGNNYISDNGVNSLVKILSIPNNNTALTTLVLRNNGITDQGAEYLVQLLKINHTLSWLYLEENQIRDDGVRILAKTLENQNNKLKMLVLSSNKLITDTSIDYLIPMIQQNQTLKKLWIDNCNLSEAGKQRLDEIQQSRQDFYIRM
ncbi:unnamed protein product [Adineta steineri]|uniref:Uncharacterized protein n=1 Tax=Adineta steineri TaxID=433720 RepID=A0A819AQI6_9BILA|nr:unnamed protein product [Adineta steineri]